MNEETRAHMGEAVPLIYQHLWEGKTPPRSPDKNPWSIGRELNIWKRLVASGFDPEALNGAITVVRTVRPYDGPMRLTWFYARGMNPAGNVEWSGTTLLQVCIGYWHKNQHADRKHRAKLPPSIQDTLREMVR